MTLKFHQRTPKPDKQLQCSSLIYKINSNKSMAFLYTKDKQAEKEIRETTPFSIVTNNIKYLDVTLTKEVKDLYDKNFKSLKNLFLSLCLFEPVPRITGLLMCS